jgi:enoyl-CoA hydratase
MKEIDIQVRSDGVAVLTLNAPQRRNSLTLVMARDIVAACDSLDANPAVGATVVRSAGTVFCAGADRGLLAEVGNDPSAEANYLGLMQVYESFSRIARLTMPTVSAVQGTALGAGVNLALSADLCLVAEDARLLSGFLPLGVHPGGGHFTLLSQRAGPQLAAAMGLFGHELVGAQAVAAGLAFEVCAADSLDSRALELAAVPGADPTLSRRSTESMRLQLGEPHAQMVATKVEQPAQMWSLRRRGGVP